MQVTLHLQKYVQKKTGDMPSTIDSHVQKKGENGDTAKNPWGENMVFTWHRAKRQGKVMTSHVKIL